MAITIATLKKGAESLGITPPAMITKKDLEVIITEKLSEMELGYECPACGKDIPDVDVCPYCNESFVDGVEENVQFMAEEANVEVEDNQVHNTAAPENNETPVQEASDKVQNTKAGQKDKAVRKPNTQKSEEIKAAYEELLKGVKEILSSTEYEERINTSGTTFLIDKKRIFKTVSSAKSISIEFNVVLNTQDSNIKTFTEEEAKAKHLGTVRAIYSFDDLETALSLVKEAFEIRMGLQTVTQ